MKTFNSFITHLGRIVLIFLLVFIWVRYYEPNLSLCLVYTSILTFASDCLLSMFLQKRDIKTTLKKQEITDAENFANLFVLNGNAFANNFWHKTISQKHTATKKTYYTSFEKNSEKVAIYSHYTLEKLRPSDVLSIYNKLKKEKIDKIIICTNEVEPQSKTFISHLPCKMVILDKYEAYEKLMKKYNSFPEVETKINLNETSKWKSFLAFSLNRGRVKGYVFSSIILIISSFFVRASVYYLVISTILLCLAIFSFTNTYYNKKIPEEII